MTDDTSEGWTNRETWAIQLHLSNNEADYHVMRDHAFGIAEAHDNAVGDRTGAVSVMAEYIKDWTEEVFEIVLDIEDDTHQGSKQARMFVSDVGSWWRADFYEIASHWIDEAYESLAS